MTHVIVICGPTAVGKSRLAVQLARSCGGEIVSADSRQIYRGLDIGTGKITAENMQGVPHHLLDVADPNDYFSVVDYKRLAEKATDEISARRRFPLIVGGTGLYIHALLENVIYPAVPPNQELRHRLEHKTNDELFLELEMLDPEYAKKIDGKNPRRLIRALEIATVLGKVPPPHRGTPRYTSLRIGLGLSSEELRAAIAKRLDERLEQGMIEEVDRLHEQGVSWSRMEALGLEYRYLARFLQNMMSRDEMRKQLMKSIWMFAKRQMTWFRRDKAIQWFHPDEVERIRGLTASLEPM